MWIYLITAWFDFPHSFLILDIRSVIQKKSWCLYNTVKEGPYIIYMYDYIRIDWIMHTALWCFKIPMHIKNAYIVLTRYFFYAEHFLIHHCFTDLWCFLNRTPALGLLMLIQPVWMWVIYCPQALLPLSYSWHTFLTLVCTSVLLKSFDSRTIKFIRCWS